jgi:hypothetical protein
MRYRTRSSPRSLRDSRSSRGRSTRRDERRAAGSSRLRCALNRPRGIRGEFPPLRGRREKGKRNKEKGKPPRSLERGHTSHTTKAAVVVAIAGRSVRAERRQQMAGLVVIPRSATTHTVPLIFVIPILAPLPHVASDVEEPEPIRRKTAHRRGIHKTIVITGITSFPCRSSSPA